MEVKARRPSRTILRRLILKLAPLSFLTVLLVHASESSIAPASLRPQGWSDISYYLPMHDGVKLAVSVWFPEHQPPKTPVPVILIQTRYGRAGVFNFGENGQYKRFLQAGFAVAVIDTRGTTSSYGSRVVEIGPQEAADMDTLIRHFRHQTWSTGEVIATGVSYMADTADIAAANSAHLTATIVRESDFDAYLDLFSPGGVANEAMMNGWGGDTLLRDYGKSSNPEDGLDCAARAGDCAKLFPRLQPVDGDDANQQLRAAIASRARHWQPQDYDHAEFRDDKASNGFTEFASSPAAYLEGLRRESVPAQYWGSWMDAGTADAALTRYRSLPKVPMDVWITAETHIGDKLTDPFFPSESAPSPSVDEQWATMLRFIQRVRSRRPIGRSIHYYVLGARDFRTTSEWPPADAQSVVWHFGPEHALIPAAASVEGEDIYTVDRSASTGAANRWSTQMGTPAAYEDRRLEDRKLLTYTSAPFAEDTELLGSSVLTLYIATKSTDPAFFAYLEDVAPGGRVTYITEGLFRAVHRRPATPGELPYAQTQPASSYLRQDAQPMVPGKAALVTFPLFPVAALIQRDHQLRLSLAASDRSAFRQYGDDADVWRVERTSLQPSALQVFTRPWKRGAH